jgi:ribosomal protein S18 acetylase RimI-like enzyme
MTTTELPTPAPATHPDAAHPGAARLTVRAVALHDPLVRPLLDGLAHEYGTRYERLLTPAQLRDELEHYGAEEFAPPDGELVLVLDAGEPVAGGAFRRRREPELGDPARLTRAGARTPDGTPAVRTAELKRIWTHAAHRRRGLARVVLAELEARAAARGYPRIYLTTGPRQPEAVGLYRAAGYTPLFDPAADPETVGAHAFEKWLVTS